MEEMSFGETEFGSERFGNGSEKKTKWDTLKEVPFGEARTETAVDDAENKEQENEILERQAEDAGALMNFCDEEDVNKIMQSDSYNTLFENGVTMEDLLGSEILFDKEYYDDGYIKGKEYYRRESEERRAWIDRKRAKEAGETIDYIAENFFGENVPLDEQEIFKQVFKAGPENVSDSLKNKIRDNSEPGPIQERILYGGKKLDEERMSDAVRWLNGLDKRAEGRAQDGMDPDRYKLSELCYAQYVYEDYKNAGRIEYTGALTEKIKRYANENFDAILHKHGDTDDYDEKAMKAGLIAFVSPDKIAKAIADGEKIIGDDGFYEDANSLVKTIISNVEAEPYFREGFNKDGAQFILDYGKELKEIGADEDVIAGKVCSSIPLEIINGKKESVGKFEGRHEAYLNQLRLEKLVKDDAISKETAVKYLDNASWGEILDNWGRDGDLWDEEEGCLAPNFDRMLKSDVFDITDLAISFPAKTVINQLPKLLENGADARRLVEYISGYHQDGGWPQKGIYIVYDTVHAGNVGGVGAFENDRLYCSSKQDDYNGVGLIGEAFDVLAEHGITEEQIVECVDGASCYPQREFVQNMLRSKSVDQDKFLHAAYEKCTAYLAEKGMNPNTVKQNMTESAFIFDAIRKHLDDTDESLQAFLEKM